MSTLVSSPPTSAVMARRLVTAAGSAGAVGSAGYISTIFLLSELSVRDAVRSPLTITSNLVVAVAFAVLAASVASLADSQRLPRWAGVVAAVGCAFVAASAWGTATLAVHAAGLLTEEQMTAESVWFTLFQAPQTLPSAVGFIALAVAGLRSRTGSRGAFVLLLLAGVVSLLPAYPPGALLAALALTWVATSARPRTDAG